MDQKRGKDERNRIVRYTGYDFVQGKMPKDGDWEAFHKSGQWREGSARDMLKWIYRGYAFAPIFDNPTVRKSNHFDQAHHIAIDFDTDDERSSLQALADDPFANYFATFGYTTPSHQVHKPRSRLLFIFDQPVTDGAYYEDLYQALLWRFPAADRSAKDAARMFYGSPGCQVWDNWSLLPLKAASVLIEQWGEAHPAPKPEPKPTISITYNTGDAYIRTAIEREAAAISTAATGERHNALVKSAYALGSMARSPHYDLTESSAINALIAAASWAVSKADIRDIRRTVTDCVTTATPREPKTIDYHNSATIYEARRVKK